MGCSLQAMQIPEQAKSKSIDPVYPHRAEGRNCLQAATTITGLVVVRDEEGHTAGRRARR